MVCLGEGFTQCTRPIAISDFSSQVLLNSQNEDQPGEGVISSNNRNINIDVTTETF